MNSSQRVVLLVLSGILAANRSTPQQPEHPAGHHWSYSGPEGPQQWGALEPDFAECSTGHHQSPININTATAVTSDLPELQFHYNSSPLNIVDNGHTVMVTYAPGSTITVGGKSYELKQFHFHHPSEEHINDKGFDIVAHLVHQDSAGHTVVVAVLMKTGSSNPLMNTLWKNLPAAKNKPATPAAVSINAQALLPASHGYYTFEGSLTTPPCTENVTWYVLKEPEQISATQVATFAKIYPRDARPIQPLNDRKIAQTSY